ncbi:unknown [[Mannheimia] succiniciproducens MBEL55E]|uniref:Uncharacterized protein n=1 Tax=Mannheimia succiniciproducens (strain KCTC 0769BP / MBEL55E) TaxID=221988 RepID=Q65SX4_MANSM|nr:unknown [[Mannheimia] succiniciproducens MBEL55E]
MYLVKFLHFFSLYLFQLAKARYHSGLFFEIK